MKYKLPIILLPALLFSCNVNLSTDTSPKGDFELFFEYLENDYSYRSYHPFSMEELRDKYLSRIETSNTKETLAEILLSITINDLKDPHVGIDSSEPYRLAHIVEKAPVILEKKFPLFLEIDVFRHTPYYTYGVTRADPKIGYLYIRDFNSDVGGSSSLEIDRGVKEIDSILAQLTGKEITSMIVDIRSEAGGTNYIPKYIARRFIDKEAVYMIEDYPVSKSFKRKKWRIKPSGGEGFRKGRIALLSNGLTASGGEMFLLAMLQRDNLVHIGSRSAGAAGNIADKDLSNGWNITITNSRTMFPDGRQYFKTGIKPAVIVKNNSTYGETTFNDQLIEKAVEILN